MKTLLLLVIFFSGLHASAAPLFTADRSCACPTKGRDLFEEPIRFAFGKFAGACVDSCRFRRARVLESGANDLVLANVLHEGKFVEARIRLNHVTGVEAGFERFAPGVDHVLLRFTFDDDVALVAQDGSGLIVDSTRAIVVSSEGVPARGQTYSLRDGYWGNYLLDHRVISDEELRATVKRKNHPLRLLRLSLLPAQAARVLVRGIRRSDTESFATVYRLFANNCSTSALALLDAETGFRAENWDPLHWEDFEAALPIVGPVGTEHALRYRGLLGGPESAEMPTSVSSN